MKVAQKNSPSWGAVKRLSISMIETFIKKLRTSFNSPHISSTNICSCSISPLYRTRIIINSKIWMGEYLLYNQKVTYASLNVEENLRNASQIQLKYIRENTIMSNIQKVVI